LQKMPPHRKPPWARQERVAKRRNEPGEGHRVTDRHRAFAKAGKGEDGRALIYGLHAVGEALANPKREVLRFLVTENALRRLDLGGSAKPAIRPEIVSPQAIARLLPPDAVHQGALVEALPLEAPALEALAPEGVVLALDQITDPHNVGAILRTAAAFAVRAVIVPVRHSPAATGVLAKSASGALEHVPLIPVRNLADALIALGERGFLRVGLDSEGEVALEEVALGTPLVLALGAEGKGLRDRVRQSCDVLARIDLPGSIKSLNVSNAAAIALATAHRRVGTASSESSVKISKAVEIESETTAGQ
jgi:23S rRNA (guanosine2251-2'-O)-methyltransferase